MGNLKSADGLQLEYPPEGGCPRLVDAATGKTVRFEPARVPGRGWTVVKVVGSKRTGRTIERAPDFADIDSYTLHQAQAAAAALTRDVHGFLAPEYQKRIELQCLRNAVARVMRA